MDLAGFLLNLGNSETNTEAHMSRPSWEEFRRAWTQVWSKRICIKWPVVVYRENDVN